ncbi:GTP cyclohydrolase II [Paracoccus gahaiensis]|uniref:GTP cyclohydrolase-2 n=1 Tax=Paracoccus gahaiensis TaxID=1706839 RepID=A0A4U0RE94_9RHOB|nr:GTP cyclohydrolase II [Paracoccus gahaiensis]TJZ92952.1 GTP cyclohydrolase II [Paracoccus gahaiensis]
MKAFPPASPMTALGGDPLALRLSERVARMVSDLRLGLPVVLTGADGPAMVYPVETLSSERFAERGDDCQLVVTARRAEALRHRPHEGEVALLAVPSGARLDWIQALADPSRGMPPSGALPQATQRAPGVLHRAAIRLVKAAELLPAALVATGADVIATALRHDLCILPAADALTQLQLPRDPRPVSNARVPMLAARNGRLHVFRAPDGGAEHYVVEVGQPDRTRPVLVRLHSACFTGDVLGSLKCDCGPQLQAALAAMEAEGAGVLLYLNQEGRGIGLANKMRAYSLQDQGLDTVEANHRLGFEDDERDFRTGAALLRQMGIGQVRLMTNNPAKIARLADEGIDVAERVPLKIGRGPDNTRYLDTKARKSGHLLA